MLGFFTMDAEDDAADRLLFDTANALGARGMRLAGAVQSNIDRGEGQVCDMDLAILGDDGPAIRISQSLGNCSQGCRLDTEALTFAVARAEAVLARGADLVIVNKFGKLEAAGRGFRDFIAAALAEDVPVLLHVPPDQLPEFWAFAGTLAEEIDPEGLIDWCKGKIGRAA
ncbi:DUF2478 domain-containing protein [Paracoccus ravus]|uniref:DUF2478 domain-containing protein n=1 Tax=Paracoccus ravus TaxID=2447760 RepID=UPI00106EF1A4|nr:DUF2478 domain-containing protein [Paracoccus ravus]